MILLSIIVIGMRALKGHGIFENKIKECDNISFVEALEKRVNDEGIVQISSEVFKDHEVSLFVNSA